MTVEDQILDIIAREGQVSRESLTPDATLESLGIASIDVINVLMAIEEDLKVYVPIDGDWSQLRNVGDLVKALAEKVNAKKAS